MKVRWSSYLLLPALAAFSGCRSYSDAEAEGLVRTYNAHLIQAFRAGDQQIMEGLVGDEEAKKLLGLIGVKSDMGINLDSRLTDFKLLRIERPARGRVEVLTEERWQYQNREIGSGRIVGLPSEDHYFMRYILARKGKAWVVDALSFEKPPVVGREAAPIQAPPRVFHGLEDSGKGAAAPRPEQGKTP